MLSISECKWLLPVITNANAKINQIIIIIITIIIIIIINYCSSQVIYLQTYASFLLPFLILIPLHGNIIMLTLIANYLNLAKTVHYGFHDNALYEFIYLLILTYSQEVC